MARLVYGVGINDKSRPCWVENKNTKSYEFWVQMLRRCFSKTFHVKNPTYKDCSVSTNFLNYSFFYDWCQEQIGFVEDDWQLDKDILVKGNKLYSESNCCFIPQEINKFFNVCFKKRGECPLGVSFYKRNNSYMATVCINNKNKNLGYFDTPQEAFLKYKSVKEFLCKQLAMKWQSQIDPRVFDAMMKWEVNYETPTNI